MKAFKKLEAMGAAVMMMASVSAIGASAFPELLAQKQQVVLKLAICIV